MHLSFHGAAGEVTGSCHLLEAAGKKVLVDCGLFQGDDTQEAANAADFGFNPAKIDILLLTHAHLDHCGRIPLLVKRGFRGEIITTAPTRALAKLVMLDAAHIQEEDAKHASKHRQRQGGQPVAPLFDEQDVLRALDAFGRIAVLDRPIELAKGISAEFINAGHILGAASVVLDVTEGNRSRRILFSGDLGNSGRPVLHDPTPPPKADYVIMETTYGDRNHKAFDATVTEFLDAVRQTLARGGNVVIPTFALERSQEILFHLAQAVDQEQLPRNLPVFLDSPMAISATGIFRQFPSAFKDAFRTQIMSDKDPFTLPDLQFTRQVAESKQISHIRQGAVILAGSGMCTGGRVRHHLRHNLWRPESSVIFVGFAVEGTLARQIIDGAKQVHLFGEDIVVNCHIHTINGFSAHADQHELLSWHSDTGTPVMTFLVHGEPDRAIPAMADCLQKRGAATISPTLHQRVALD